MSSTSGSLMNITRLICLSDASMLGFSCSNDKVDVKLCYSTFHLVVPLHSSWLVYHFVGIPSNVCTK
jgi:hypothetical protein